MRIGRTEKSEANRWRAVLRRDRASDGAFFFAVRSTGIYCRPSCPARRPRREQVIFFAAPHAAESAGFRPCRRCHPLRASAPEPMAIAVEQACREIQETFKSDPDARFTLAALASRLHARPHALDRAFRCVLGVTARQYGDAIRLRRFKTQLQKGDDVTTALYATGYGSSSRIYEKANLQLGMTPGTYRRGGAGMFIGYTIVDSPLGRLLVGATSKGVSAVYLGESDAMLRTALRREYPRAELRKESTSLRTWVEALLKYLRGREPWLDLPLDVRATAFQRMVWEELRRIPLGKTRTYTEVARSIGMPTAFRAVARACATNPVSLIVPCHRVVRRDGSPAGYRWGVERKCALIENEKKQASRAKAGT
jgi:AraC family transcriptional regulator of adaptative response/methylated-DNA-[protein]-cysteine methyltransferase